MTLKLPGFLMTALLQEGRKSLIWRGIREVDSFPVIVKGLRSEQCTPQNIDQLKHEYAITQQLNSPETLRALSLELYRGMPYLILEDFGGQSLDRLLNQFQETEEFLRIAIQIVAALAQIHQQQIVHKDIKPQNIFVNQDTKQVKIGDFGLAAFIPYEGQLVSNSNRIEGSLPYMSPEQTGRMNRGIDQRSDLYPLGITFYEMLTGQLPFQGNDPLEWIHCHIAKSPLAPVKVKPTIPQVLSDIVMKLLAKLAEARYQSAAGLKFDLERCLQAWQTTGLQPFPLGEQDFSERLLIPQKLYGREQEIAQLTKAFARVVTQGKPELILVSGYSGVGKSSLVNELHKPIVQARGIFISGKFDQYKRDIPYSTIIQAFQGLVRQLLTEPEQKLAIWRDRIQASVGNNGKLIADVIPEVELIIGEQPPVPVLGPTESQNRFNLVFQNFIGAFAQNPHPLAIFLDDMQWADNATLNLILALATSSNIQFLCFLLAYRDNEVDVSHPFSLMLEKLHQQGIQPTAIVLSPLDFTCVNQLISETLRCPVEQSESLARLVFQKTHGNPYFVNEFLKTLHQENLLTFIPPQSPLTKKGSKGGWQWNLNQIEAKGITDNVVNLMVERMQKLPSLTQHALKLASCIGNHFDLDILAIVAEESPQNVADALAAAILKGLIVSVEQTENTEKQYYFVHDRVQQAAYALIPDTQKQLVHLQIGRLLLKNLDSEQLEEQLFDVVNQLNLGCKQMTAQTEKDELVRLNVLAGQRAKNSTAYVPALKYFDTASRLLSPNAWNRQYSLTFNLFIELAECQYLTGQLKQAETLFELLLSKAQSNLEKANIYILQVKLYQVAGKFDKAFGVGLEALKLFGVTFPDSDEEVQAAIETERSRVMENLGDRQIADLLDATIIQDPILKTPISLLTSLGPPAYLSKPNLFPLVVLKALNFSLKFGNTEESCFAYSMYAMLLVSVFRDIPAGYDFSEMTIRLNRKLNDPKYKGTVLHIHGSHINVWCNHMVTDLPFLEQGFLGCVEAGDITMANYNGFQGSWQIIEVISPLTEAYQAIQKYVNFAQQSKHAAAYQTIRLQQQFIMNLRGLTASSQTLSDNDFDESRALSIIINAEFASGIVFYHIIKLIVFFTYEQYRDALNSAAEAFKVLGAVLSLPIEANYVLHHSLVLAALYPDESSEMQAEFLATLQHHHQQLQYWADRCPANFLHKSLLVAAEIARIEGHDLEAMRLYEGSIRSAREHQFVQYEALACELAAKFYLTGDFEAIAKTYLQEARNAYLRWGAISKVRQLEEKYHTLLPKQQSISSKHHSSANTTFVSSSEQLDILSVIKASQTISSEIILPKLLHTLMQIAIEQAGAEVGYLLLSSNGKLAIEVAAKANQKDEKFSVQQFVAGTKSSQVLPQSILNYVQRTQEVVILDNAAEPNLFSEDGYLIRNQPKSILCLPITRQSHLIGILYLENNLATGAFTGAQLSALKILSTQIAISLENARLYQKVAESQEQLNLALKSGEIGVWSWDIPNNCMEWDEQMYQTFGVNPETFDCTLEAVLGCLHPDDRDYFMQTLSQTLAEGVEHNLEYRVILSNGTIRHIAARGRPFFNETGQPIQMRGIVLDITERKLAEEGRLQLLREQVARAAAEASYQQSAFLAEVSAVLASSLEYEQTLQSIADLAVPYFADWCSVDLLNEDGTIIRVAVAHCEPEKVRLGWEIAQRYPRHLDDGYGISQVMKTGQSEIAQEITDEQLTSTIHDTNYLQILRGLGLKSCIIAPLKAGGRVLGSISFIFTESERRYRMADLTMAEDLARRAAIAIDNARLYQDAQQARLAAEKAADRTARLQTVTAALSESLTPLQVVDVIVEQSMAALEATSALVVLASKDRKELEIVKAVGYQADLVESWQRFSIDLDAPLAQAVRTKEPVWMETIADRIARYPHLAHIYGRYDFNAWMSLPLVTENRSIGGILLSFKEFKPLSQDERSFILALSRQCAQAIFRAQLYEAEQNARAEAEQANRVKDEFLAVLSHELRSPLNPILGWTKLLRTQRLQPKQVERALETIERNAKLQSQLVEDLLDISRMFRGKLSLNTAPINMTAIIQAAIETVQLAASAKSIYIQTVLQSTNKKVLGDGNRLQQVIWNLLSNAIKFTSDGGRVEVRLEEIGHQVQIQVIDNGRGIQSDFLPHVFEYFRQADSSTTRQFGGLGLGLAIVRQIVELHGGTVRAESPGEGMGATFTVLLPATGTQSQSSTSTQPLIQSGDLTGLRVLVVDDETDMGELAKFVLLQHGAQVTVASSAAEALAILTQFIPDALLCDIGMPEMDGYMLMRQIRALLPEKGGTIPAIALTAYASEYDRRQALAAGFQLHLPKPIEPDKLVAEITKLLK